MANDDEIKSKQTEAAQVLQSEISQQTRIENLRFNFPTNNTNSSVETEATVVN